MTIYVNTLERALTCYSVDVTSADLGLVLRFAMDLGPLSTLAGKIPSGTKIILPTAGYSAQSSGGNVQVFAPIKKRGNNEQKIIGMLGFPFQKNRKRFSILSRPIDVLYVEVKNLNEVATHLNLNSNTAQAVLEGVSLLQNSKKNFAFITEGQSNYNKVFSLEISNENFEIPEEFNKEKFSAERVTERLAGSREKLFLLLYMFKALKNNNFSFWSVMNNFQESGKEFFYNNRKPFFQALEEGVLEDMQKEGFSFFIKREEPSYVRVGVFKNEDQVFSTCIFNDENTTHETATAKLALAEMCGNKEFFQSVKSERIVQLFQEPYGDETSDWLKNQDDIFTRASSFTVGYLERVDEVRDKCLYKLTPVFEGTLEEVSSKINEGIFRKCDYGVAIVVLDEEKKVIAYKSVFFWENNSISKLLGLTIELI